METSIKIFVQAKAKVIFFLCVCVIRKKQKQSRMKEFEFNRVCWDLRRLKIHNPFQIFSKINEFFFSVYVQRACYTLDTSIKIGLPSWLNPSKLSVGEGSCAAVKSSFSSSAGFVQRCDDTLTLCSCSLKIAGTWFSLNRLRFSSAVSTAIGVDVWNWSSVASAEFDESSKTVATPGDQVKTLPSDVRGFFKIDDGVKDVELVSESMLV